MADAAGAKKIGVPSTARKSRPDGWGGWSYKYDKQTHADQGVDADNCCAEAKIGHDAFGSEVKLRDAHWDLPMQMSAAVHTTREMVDGSRPNRLVCN
jgi:hypothetical protein